MEKITIPTAFNIDLEFEAAGLLQRIAAWLIDAAVTGLYLYIAYEILEYYEGDEYFGNDYPIIYNIQSWQTIIFAPALLYHLACEVWMNGQTVGKKICGIRVVSENGGRPSLYQYLVRWVSRFTDFTCTLAFGAAYGYMISRKKQRPGDIAAGTLVIKSSLQGSLTDDTTFTELSDAYQAKYAQVLQLSDADMNSIRRLLKAYHTHQPGSSARADRAADLIREALHITDWKASIPFLEGILKDYNSLSHLQTDVSTRNLLTEIEEESTLIPATPGQRFLNFLIDLGAFYLFYIVFFSYVSVLLSGVTNGLTHWVRSIPLMPWLVYMIFYATYYMLQEVVTRGNSFGKLITRTRAVNIDGSPISYKTAIYRSLARAVPFAVVSGLGPRPWHDKWTNTMVVKR